MFVKNNLILSLFKIPIAGWKIEKRFRRLLRSGGYLRDLARHAVVRPDNGAVASVHLDAVCPREETQGRRDPDLNDAGPVRGHEVADSLGLVEAAGAEVELARLKSATSPDFSKIGVYVEGVA